MATTSDIQVKVLEKAGYQVSLENLPFPAALVDFRGAIASINNEWKAAWPATGLGQLSDEWRSQLYPSDTGSRDAVAAAVEQVLRGAAPRITIPGSNSDSPVIVSACPPGALVVYSGTKAPAAPAGRDLHSQRMETVGRLTGGVAHDFANLLTLIAGYADLRRNQMSPNDPLRPELDEIRKAANRGAGLTGQLLGFTRGRTAEPKPVDLNSLILDMQRMLRPIIGEHVELRTALAQGLGKVMADQGQMEQVIMNLILNARDAMPSGGRIRIETSVSEFDEASARAHSVKAGRYVLLSISDTGHGIDPKVVERIFEPFFTTKETGKGTGIGLSTAMSIVKQSGGDIWVRSAPGEGAFFTLCLPSVPQEAERAETTTAPRIQVAGCETVLLVEDEEGVRRLLSHVLRRNGYKVLEACDGVEALRIFEQRAADIDLVLTDMVMPKMTGRELGERVREINPHIRLMYMSGYTDDVLARTGALEPGMSFLQKPLRPDALAAKVRETLDSPA